MKEDVIYNVIEIEVDKSEEEIKKDFNFKFARLILKFWEKVRING